MILPCPALPALDVPKLALEVESCVVRLRRSKKPSRRRKDLVYQQYLPLCLISFLSTESQKYATEMWLVPVCHRTNPQAL